MAAILRMEFWIRNGKFDFLVIKNPRKVLSHKIIIYRKWNLPNYFQYDVLGGGHFEK